MKVTADSKINQVKLESIDILFKNNQTSFITASIVAVALLFFTRLQINIATGLTWLGMLFSAYSVRSLIGFWYKKSSKNPEQLHIWLNTFRVASALCGAVWGLSVHFIVPNNSLELQAVILLVLAGVSCGGLINLSLDTIAATSFAACLWLFASPVMLIQENNGSSLLFALLALYIIYVWLASRQLSRGLILSIKSKLIAQNKEREVTELTKRQSLHLQHTPMGVIEWDENFNVTAWNRACVEIFGYTNTEALGKHISFFMPELANLDTGHIIARLKQENNVLKQLHNKNIEAVYYELSNTILENQDNQFIGMASMVQNKTDFIASQEKIHQLAYFDTLTSLPNRGLLLDRINQALAISQRNKSYGMIAFIDLDHFKAINDIKGHEVGDFVLKTVAQRLQQNTRAQDTAARLGGDEFVLVLPGIGETEFQAEAFGGKVIKKIMDAINMPVQHLEYQHQCSASIGMCLFNDNSLEATELLRRADVAMYLSKKQGRNTFQFYDDVKSPNYEYQLRLKHDLNYAIKKNQFELYLQGQYSGNNILTGAEALIRWRHPELGLIMPNDFIVLAEETGIIVQIGEWVLNEACALLKKWQADKALSELIISVNASAVQFNHDAFIPQIKNAIQQSGCDATKLSIELTESALINNTQEAIKKMHLIKAMEVSLAIDDFGTGFSSLSMLQNLPLNELKIDRSFVKDFSKNPIDLTIVQTILQMGKNLNIRVVAEGVETESQLGYLSNYGCNLFQGYFFARPCSIGQFENKLTKPLASAQASEQLKMSKPSVSKAKTSRKKTK